MRYWIVFLSFFAALSYGQVAITKITNAADLTNDPGVQFEIPMQGGLATIYCTGLTGPQGVVSAGGPNSLSLQLAGVSVDVFGVPAPILSVAFMQGYQAITIQVPWEVGEIIILGVYDNFIEVRQSGQYGRAQASISGVGHLFTDANGYGIFQRVSDYSLVTPANPAHPGEVLVAYATGMGISSVRLSQQTGYPAPAQPLQPIGISESLWLAGAQVGSGVFFEGLTPGLVGVDQINFSVPASAPSGDDAVQLSITFSECGPFGVCGPGQQPTYVTTTSPSVKLPVR